MNRLIISAILLAFIAVIPFLHSVSSSPEPSLSALYTIPVAVAALIFSPLVVLVITTLALISHSISAWIDGVSLLSWATHTLVLISIAFLGIRWAQHERGVDALAEKTKRLSEERLQLVDKLTESRLEREQFIGAIMFETKGVLTAILDFVSVLARRADLYSTEEGRRLEAVVNQAQHLSRLISDMQTASQVERGKFTVSPTRGDLRKLVSRVVLEQQALSPRHEIVLHVPNEDVEASFDQTQMARALENLIRNAVNYSPHGGRIEVVLTRASDSAQIAVIDHGTGISRVDLPKLFRPYVRLAPAKETSGIGIGLFISKAVVEAHGGRISVESKLGYGSSFQFTVPLSPNIRPVEHSSSSVDSSE